MRKLLAGRLLRMEERQEAEGILALPDPVETALRLRGLLETLASRDALVRLNPPAGRESHNRRYLDPATNDRWTIRLPGPRAVDPEGSPTAEDRPEPAAPVAPAAQSAPSPRIVKAVETFPLEPGLTRKFYDPATGEPLRTLFSGFAPCRSPEEFAASLAPIRDLVLRHSSATQLHFFLLEEVVGADDGSQDEATSLIPVTFPECVVPAAHELGKAVRRSVLQDQLGVHVPDLTAREARAPAGEQGALVCLPMTSGDRVVGSMEVLRDAPGPFETEELAFFSLAAAVTGGLVVRAESLEKLIFLDKLTGLYNRAYFDDQILREIERANRTGTSVALLMADLDHFKRINDSHGHQVGDRALAFLASIIRANIRQIDVAARYGGEEFAILLPTITRARAVLTAERLRRVVAEASFSEIAPELDETRVSVSLGLALYPDDAGSAVQLIERADRVALYAAKNRGRNRVVSWASIQEQAEDPITG
ncbi:MAG: sensor domain-containing diguanylate cyclase [Gemmatimonadota bacterium]|nr:sensor domain-containing diguanylate cyclase [Gemmatimonadota bacterium]MDP6801721.1 sensor domain-containing diguanylate cyclase [Gemmatimonadota bacterium]MDP7031203.1 sensor domain-containing diguanylate cyclase [Gemmatimonadota bacterium]